jgi:hypothetical protein
MTTQAFKIVKNYAKKPSKNTVWENNISWDDAVIEIARVASSWKRNGGLVIEETNTFVIVEEGDGSETITFSIEEM